MSKKRKGFDVERDIMISVDSFPPEAAERCLLEMRVSHLLRDACRPLDENRYFQIAFYVAEKAKELGGDHGCMESALKDAAEHFHQAYSTVRDIYYVSCAVEDWERAVKAERVWRAWPARSAL